MKAIVLLLAIIFLSSCFESKDEPILSPLPKEKGLIQEQFIGQLSGEFLLYDEVRLKGRWSNDERHKTRKYLKSRIEQLGLQPIAHYYRMPHVNPIFDLILDPFKGVNLYTILPATAPSKEYIVLGAHYDTGAENVPGAIDNASGMALIYSTLVELQKLRVRNKNIIIVFFDQEEEEEQVGSAAFVKLLVDRDYAVHSVHTCDMIGWDSDNNREVELAMPSRFLEELYHKHAAILNIPIYTTQIISSDHYSFIKKGYATVGISQAYAKGDNSGKKDTPADQFHLVNFEYLESTANLVYQVISELII